jgi:hypothetical protein
MNYLCGKDCPCRERCGNGSLAARPQKPYKVFWVSVLPVLSSQHMFRTPSREVRRLWWADNRRGRFSITRSHRPGIEGSGCKPRNRSRRESLSWIIVERWENSAFGFFRRSFNLGQLTGKNDHDRLCRSADRSSTWSEFLTVGSHLMPWSVHPDFSTDQQPPPSPPLRLSPHSTFYNRIRTVYASCKDFYALSYTADEVIDAVS